jgi:stage II sporulation protein M
MRMEIREQYKLCWKTIKESKNYIYFSVVAFIVITILGFMYPLFFMEEIKKLIQELGSMFEGLGLFWTIGLIFVNNLRTVLITILLGIFFVFPLLILLLNSYLAGAVSSMAVSEFGYSTLWRLFPHGIFELPAIWLGIALGLKIGVELIVGKNSLKKNYVDSLRVFIFVILPLLLVAAIIEGVLVWAF